MKNFGGGGRGKVERLFCFQKAMAEHFSAVPGVEMALTNIYNVCGFLSQMVVLLMRTGQAHLVRKHTITHKRREGSWFYVGPWLQRMLEKLVSIYLDAAEIQYHTLITTFSYSAVIPTSHCSDLIDNRNSPTKAFVATAKHPIMHCSVMPHLAQLLLATKSAKSHCHYAAQWWCSLHLSKQNLHLWRRATYIMRI